MGYCVEGLKHRRLVFSQSPDSLTPPPLRETMVLFKKQKKNHQAVNPVPHLAPSCSVFSSLLIIGGPACWCVAMFAHEQAAK